MSAARPRMLLVAGMHRSGTSALARVLSLCGGELPRTLFPAAEGDNDLGYWESTPLIEHHEHLFRMLGTTMLDPDPIDSRWFDTGQAMEARHDLMSIVRREWPGEGLMVVKEPRICRLMPLWRDVVEELGAEAAWVLPVREPGEVAASLVRRGGIDAARAERSWLSHVVQAERWTRGLPRVVVSYAALLDDWRGVVARIAAVSPAGLDAARAEREVDAFLEPGRRRHAVTAASADSDVRAVRDAMFDAARTGTPPSVDSHGAEALDRAWRRLLMRCG